MLDRSKENKNLFFVDRREVKISGVFAMEINQVGEIRLLDVSFNSLKKLNQFPVLELKNFFVTE